MPVSVSIKPNLYKDSVALMRIGQLALAQEGVQRVTLLMGTPANKAILAASGLLDPALEAARPGDVMISVEADSEQLDAALAEVASQLEGTQRKDQAESGGAEAAKLPLRSIAMARTRCDAVLAQISVPGPYAAGEAMKALRNGMHVFLFSDNVPLEQERALKELAARKGLLVMGPDCGTAIIRGTPLGFANVVQDGAIGLVGASGTGLQEVSSQIDKLGQGIRHAIGTGGRDVYAEIGGTTMRQAIDLLAADPATRVIGIVSKPPAPEVAARIFEQLEAVDKPAVVLFLGAEPPARQLPPNIVVVSTLFDAAAGAVALLEGKPFAASRQSEESVRAAQAEAQRLARGQHAVRGLYSGGTFASEAQILWSRLGLRVQDGHEAIDLGDDQYTVGRPHPMIDPNARLEHIAREAADPATAVIVLDVVLGYAGHEDPAGALAPAIASAKAACAQAGRHLSVVTFVCGTERDPQRLSAQQACLREAGALMLPSSTAAARMAGEIGQRAAARVEQPSLEAVK
ncbi:acyl-CoA synthetase FdrA [Variovorax sp. LARHSF232]